jgi:tetratricopeptide (TPR) repeat protein
MGRLQTVRWSQLTGLLLVVGLALSYLAQLQFDSWARFTPPVIKTTYNIYIEPQPLSAPLARAVSFGAREFMADWYWLTAIQYYGGGDPNGQYRKLAELFTTITDLSPKFEPAYETGLIILPGEGFTDQAIALGHKGEQNLPDQWQIPYYTGLDYHIYKKDYLAAAKEFDKAAKLPGAPDNVRYFSAIYYSQADQRQVAYQLFKNIYDTTDDQFIKDRTKKYLGHLEIVFYLEDAVTAYHQKFGHYPPTLNALVTEKIIPEIPVSPLGRNYTIDPATGQVGETVKR